jgi:hypothetical protein
MLIVSVLSAVVYVHVCVNMHVCCMYIVCTLWSVCLQHQAMGVCPEVLQIPTKFHITIGMMKLFSQKEKVCSSARRLEYVFHNYNMHTYICMKHIHKHVHMLTYAHAHTHTHTHHNLY